MPLDFPKMVENLLLEELEEVKKRSRRGISRANRKPERLKNS